MFTLFCEDKAGPSGGRQCCLLLPWILITRFGGSFRFFPLFFSLCLFSSMPYASWPWDVQGRPSCKASWFGFPTTWHLKGRWSLKEGAAVGYCEISDDGCAGPCVWGKVSPGLGVGQVLRSQRSVTPHVWLGCVHDGEAIGLGFPASPKILLPLRMM